MQFSKIYCIKIMSPILCPTASMDLNLHPVRTVCSYSFMRCLVMERIERHLAVVYVKRSIQSILVVVRDKIIQTVMPPHLSPAPCRTSPAYSWSGDDTALSLSAVCQDPKDRSQRLGIHVFWRVASQITKQDPLSGRMDAVRVPSTRIVCLSTFTAFRPVASLNMPYQISIARHHPGTRSDSDPSRKSPS